MAISAQAAPAALIHTRRLSVRFGPLLALSDVDLEVAAGELIVVAGENGAGKSTLIRCLAGDLAPTSGRIRRGARRSACRVAVTWQHAELCENLDIATNFFLGRERKTVLMRPDRLHAAARNALSRSGVELPDTTTPVRALTRAQQQLLAVARAVDMRPELLLLDEPTGSLGGGDSALVERLIARARADGATVLMTTHDVEQMFRLADRILVLRHGRLVGDIRPDVAHPDDIVALMAGQHVDTSARRQLTRLHGLVDQLAVADPSSSLSLILSALGAALGASQLCIHLTTADDLRLAASTGISPPLLTRLASVTPGPAGGSIGTAAATGQASVGTPPGDQGAASLRAGPPTVLPTAPPTVLPSASWSVPVHGATGLAGVITVLRTNPRRPDTDELEILTLYAGYAANAIDRDRLLGEVTARNQVLETIREVLQSLAGPIPVTQGMSGALQAIRAGLAADQVALYTARPGEPVTCATAVSSGAPAVDHDAAAEISAASANIARLLADPRTAEGRSREWQCPDGSRFIAVLAHAPVGRTALVAYWRSPAAPADSGALLEDAAHSLRLAYERDEAERARRETTALRASQELQRQFLSRLSHELRTPLTAIRGYASSLIQPDVTWDQPSQRRFVERIGAESARLGRLVGDLLDFSAIESGLLRLQPDWCDLPLVLDAALSCLPPAQATAVQIAVPPAMPPIWADHDRLEQVFVNLLDNAFRHNPEGTVVRISIVPTGPHVLITISDDGVGIDAEPEAVFSPRGQRSGRTAGSGLGLSISKGIIDAHDGSIAVQRPERGTRFVVSLPVEQDPPKEAEQ